MLIHTPFLLLLTLLPVVHSLTVYRVEGDVINNSTEVDLTRVEKYIQQAISSTLPNTFVSVTSIRELLDDERVTFVADVESSNDLARNEIIKGLQATKTIHPTRVTKIGKSKRPALETDVVAIADGCMNGGFRLNNGSCQCKPFTSGYQCQIVHCQSWSILAADQSSCHCPPGYSARYCEQRGGRPAVETDFEINRRTFVVVISTNPSYMDTKQKIINNLEGTINAMQAGEPGYIDSYIGVLTAEAKDGSSVMASENTRNLTQFLEFLNQTHVIPNSLSDGAQPVLLAVNQALSSSAIMRSHPVVLVFANREDDSPAKPSDSIQDPSQESKLRQIVMAWHAKIYFFISKDPNYNTSSNGYDAYRRIATASHGDLIVHEPSELTQISKSFIPRLYKPEMSSVLSFGPSDSVKMSVFRDFDSQQVTVTVSIDNSPAPVKVALSNGTASINPDPGCDGTSWKVFSLPPEWTSISLKSSAKTTVSVRMFVSSDSSFIFSHSPNEGIDNGAPNNFADYQTNLNVRAVVVGDISKITTQALNTQNKPMYDMLEARQREQGFNMDYQFQAIPNCTAGVYTQLFFARLHSGQEFTRVFPGYCFKSASHPYVPPVQPTASPKPASSMSCYQMNTDALTDPRLGSFNQIMFAVELTGNLNTSFSKLVQLIGNTVSELEQHEPRKWQFTLIAFNSNGASALISTYDDDEFVKRMTMVLNEAQSIVDYPYSTHSLDAVHLASELILRSPAQLNVFTSSEPEGGSDTWRVPKNIQVNWFYIIEDLVDPSWNNMMGIERQTSGRVIMSTAGQVDTLTSTIYDSVYDNNVLVDSGFENCSGGAEIEFFVDANTDRIAFTLSGENVKVLALVDGNGVFVDLNTKLFVEFKNKASMVTSYFADRRSMAPAGKWTLTVSTSAGSCLCQVRAETDVAVIIGFSSDPNDDMVEQLPFAQRGESTASSFIMARIEGGNETYSIDRITVKEANVRDPWVIHEDTQQNSSMSLRDKNSCAYQYRSDGIVFPRVDYIQVTIYGTLKGETQLQRTFIYYTPQYTGEECAHGEANRAGQCVCDQGYTGALCDQAVCQNGGINSNGVCDCADSGFIGTFCEQVVLGAAQVSTTAAPTRISTTTEAVTTKPNTSITTSKSTNATTVMKTTPNSKPISSSTHLLVTTPTMNTTTNMPTVVSTTSRTNITTFNTTTPKYNTTHMTTIAPLNVSSPVPTNSSFTTKATVKTTSFINGTVSTKTLGTRRPNATTTISQSTITMSTPLLTTTSSSTTTTSTTTGKTTSLDMTSTTEETTTKLPDTTVTTPPVTIPPKDSATSKLSLQFTFTVVFISLLFS